ELVFARREARPIRRRLVGALVAVPIVALLYGVVRIAGVDARVKDAPKGRVGLVQANMSLMGKRKDKLEGLRRHLRLTRKLSEEGPLDLVVWSETSVMGAVNVDEYETAIPERFSRDIGARALFGSVLIEPADDERGRVFYNSAILTDAS